MSGPARNLGAAEPWGRYIEQRLQQLETQQQNQLSAVNRSLYSTSAQIGSAPLIAVRYLYETGFSLPGNNGEVSFYTSPVDWPPGKSRVHIIFSGETHLRVSYEDGRKVDPWLYPRTSYRVSKMLGHGPQYMETLRGRIGYVRHAWNISETVERGAVAGKAAVGQVILLNSGNDTDGDPDNAIQGSMLLIFE